MADAILTLTYIVQIIGFPILLFVVIRQRRQLKEFNEVRKQIHEMDVNQTEVRKHLEERKHELLIESLDIARKTNGILKDCLSMHFPPNPPDLCQKP